MSMRKASRIFAVLLGGSIGGLVLSAPACGEDNTTQTFNNGLVNPTGAITVGNSGTNNSLSISNTTTVNTTGTAVIGVNTTANANFANVTANSTWSISSFLFVGESGFNNNLNIDAGADVTTGSTTDIGRNATADGNAVLVSGTGSTFSPGGVFAVGRSGDGNTLDILAGGFVNNASVADIGAASDNNTVTVSGAGSQWTSASEIAIGNAATANNNLLHIENAGNVTANTHVFVGQTGADNFLTIDTGGDLTVTASFLIGRFAGGNGNDVVITGSGSTLTQTGAGSTVSVGQSGDSNTLTVSAGATFTTAGTNNVGAVSDNNVATVTGTGSTWTGSGEIAVGNGSTAENNELIVSNGGTVNANSNLFVGQDGDNNKLTINSGGTVAVSGNALIGRFAPATGNSVSVTGAGSTFRGNLNLFVGSTGGTNSSVSVTNGGTLQFNSILIGTATGSSISNTGGIYQFTSAGPSITPGNPGNITLNGGTISYKNVGAAANINNAQVAQIVRSGNNTFRLDNSTGSSIASYTFETGSSNFQKLELMNGGVWNGTTLTIGNGGALAGNGSVNAATTVSSTGSVSPGLSIGTINITGGLVLDGDYNVEAIIENQITDQIDLLNVAGTVDVGGATLNVVTLTNFGTSLSKSMVIIQNDGGDAVIGTFGVINSNPAVQFTIEYAYAGPGGDGNDVAIHFTHVPEPAVGAMFGIVMGVGLFRRPRNR